MFYVICSSRYLADIGVDTITKHDTEDQVSSRLANLCAAHHQHFDIDDFTVIKGHELKVIPKEVTVHYTLASIR